MCGTLRVVYLNGPVIEARSSSHEKMEYVKLLDISPGRFVFNFSARSSAQTHTQTRAHAQRERERERKDRQAQSVSKSRFSFLSFVLSVLIWLAGPRNSSEPR